MTDSAYRHIVLVIDRSGSMAEPADNYTGPTKAELANKGLAQFIEVGKQNPLRTSVSLYQFDTEHDLVADFVPLDSKVLADYVLMPRGGTALLDAIGFAMTKTGERLSALDERFRPCEVTVVVVTDGHENSSHEYKLPKIREMITHQTDAYGWRFIYLGAEPDSFDEGVSMGFARGSTSGYNAAHTVAAYASASNAMNIATASGAAPVFTVEDRKDMNDDDDSQDE